MWRIRVPAENEKTTLPIYARRDPDLDMWSLTTIGPWATAWPSESAARAAIERAPARIKQTGVVEDWIHLKAT
jgi:hypothetical protein